MALPQYYINFGLINQSLFAIVKNTSIFVKVVCILVIVGYGLCFLEPVIPAFSVTPGYILPPRFWLWTAFTHCFLEKSLWLVLIDLITLGLCGKLIEPLWGSFEMVLFFLLVNVSVAFLSALYYLIIYMCIFMPDLLFDVHIQGMAGYIAGLSVAVKQVMPDHVLVHTKTPLGKITNRHIPLLLFIFSLILYAVRILEGVYPLMVGWGMIVSWVYLRFYQVHSNGTRGDMAESFKFSSFFPTVLQPPVQLVGDQVFKVLVAVRICRKTVRKYDVGAPTSISISLPGMDPTDAERRRQKAIKLLSERLNQQDESEAWPLMEETQKTENKNSNEQIISIHTSATEVSQNTIEAESVETILDLDTVSTQQTEII